MAKTGNNYSILVDVELDTKTAKQQLQTAFKNSKINLDTKDAVNNINDLNDSMSDASLTFNVANQIFRTCIETIEAMVSQVYELDSALIEFQKVSDLSGTSLDNYVAKLSDMGKSVARTTSEMVGATTEFRKNGFNDEDAAQLGQIAA